MALSSDQYKQIKDIMDKRGVPEWVWVPIMMSESGGDPNARTSTSKEDSRGLFQINLKAHPQWKNVNLYDPIENAKLAADNFLSPAMYQAGNQGLTKEEDITAYVWRYGIRPAWSEDKNKSIRQKVADFLKNGASAIGGPSGQQKGGTTVIQDTASKVTDIVNNLLSRFMDFSWNLIPFLIGAVILIFTLKSMFLDSAVSMLIGGDSNDKK
jgi:hypothetical protein